jgi:hypothetical protein
MRETKTSVEIAEVNELKTAERLAMQTLATPTLVLDSLFVLRVLSCSLKMNLRSNS